MNNIHLIDEFISPEEQALVLHFIQQYKLPQTQVINNIHINTLVSGLKGSSLSHNFSNSKESKEIARYQGSNEINQIDKIFLTIRDRIVSRLNITTRHSFLQIVQSKSGGEVRPHYDANVEGFINFKCNLCIEGSSYKFYVDTFPLLPVRERTLYTFEASLFKHWTDKFEDDRIILSYGFLLPYEDLNWRENDPRIRLSNRINKYLQ